MNKLKLLWSRLRASFWFLPSIILTTNIFLAIVLISMDSAQTTNEWATRWPHLFGAGAAGARGMLSTIASSMMTVVGVTFSMVLVTLALASSQYTSRILRTFMRNRITQCVLGVFAGIFAYCLIVLRTIRGGDEGGFVPMLAVAMAVVMAVAGISVLILFLHHIASSIQASSIISAVTEETIATVERLFPEKAGQEAEDKNPDLPLIPDQNWKSVASLKTGYIQDVDAAEHLRLAEQHKTIVRMECGVGEFVIQGSPIASYHAGDPENEELIKALQNAYTVGQFRTVEQDAGFGIRQLVDIALRALSPGINDTTTAVMCLDYLTDILARVADRKIPSPYHYKARELRVIAIGPDFDSLVAEAMDQIRSSASGNVAILLRMLDALQVIAGFTGSEMRRRPLREQMQKLAECATRTIASPSDRLKFETRLAQAKAALEMAVN